MFHPPTDVAPHFLYKLEICFMFHLDSGKQGQLIELGLTGNYPTSILKRNFVFWLDSHRYTSLSPFLL